MTWPDGVEMWRQTRAWAVAELRDIVCRHQRDGQGRCTACVRVGLAHPGGHRRWPCDPRLNAVAALRRLNVDPYSEDEEGRS